MYSIKSILQKMFHRCIKNPVFHRWFFHGAVVPLVGVIFDSEGDFGLSLYDDTESISFYKKVALKNNVYKSYLVLKSIKC